MPDNQTHVGWPSGWALDLKLLVPCSTKCALQFESKYLHFEKTPGPASTAQQKPNFRCSKVRGYYSTSKILTLEILSSNL